MTSAEKIETLVKAHLLPQEVFHLDIRPEWGSENAEYRQEIRKGILDFLKQHHPDQIEDSIWDLEAPPVLKNFFVSISHCNGMGGFAFSNRSLGFDIEDVTRISTKIIERISTESEVADSPEVELLWSAKEAVFKSSTEFYTIAHIQILDWKPSQNDTYSFTSLTAIGWAFRDSTHSYAIAVKKS